MAKWIKQNNEVIIRLHERQTGENCIDKRPTFD